MRFLQLIDFSATREKRQRIEAVSHQVSDIMYVLLTLGCVIFLFNPVCRHVIHD